MRDSERLWIQATSFDPPYFVQCFVTSGSTKLHRCYCLLGLRTENNLCCRVSKIWLPLERLRLCLVTGLGSIDPEELALDL